MLNRLAIIIVGLSLLLHLGWHVRAQEQFTGLIRNVVDADTFDVQTDNLGSIRVRLFGINSCENSTPQGKRATKFVIDNWMGLEVSCTAQGTSFNRIVAVCFRDGANGRHDIAWDLIHAGLAVDVPRFSGGYYGKQKEQDCSK